MFHVSCFMFHENKGQSMIIATLALGGVILGATTIAGFLMTLQIRQTTNSADSAKAIFAADAGVEAALYEQFKGAPPPAFLSGPGATLGNGASVNLKCYDSATPPFQEVSCGDGTVVLAKSVGVANTARRAFSVSFGGP